jgi:hypothetical protein
MDVLGKVDSEYLEVNAHKDYNYWSTNHAISKVGNDYIKMIDSCSFTYADYVGTGINNIGFYGKAINYVKRRIAQVQS